MYAIPFEPFTISLDDLVSNMFSNQWGNWRPCRQFYKNARNRFKISNNSEDLVAVLFAYFRTGAVSAGGTNKGEK